MFVSMTAFQQALVKEYKKLAKEVYFHGIDQNELPVISYADDNGRRQPFALRRRPVLRGKREFITTGGRRKIVPIESTVSEPALPLRWFEDEEYDYIDPDTHELLLGLKRV
jgi:hypothetical protein